MIPKTNTLVVEDTLPGKETEFSIGDPFWVMESLADLYSDKETATVRELSTNAYDSNVEAGNDKPIEVSLPTIMSPYFTVKDQGIGMSPDTLEEIYTSFGVSTKRDSNSYNGMLGFGSKAPIAYTGTFTVTAVKDGVKTIGVITKRPDKIVLKVVMTSKTDEPNGVEVKVPVHNWQEFSTKAKNFYRFWKPGTVLVDGVEPKQAVGEKITNNLYYSTTPGTSFVVMGNVAYRIANPDALFRNNHMNRISFVAYVPNGSVEFTPSREDLKYTDLTKKTLYDVIGSFEQKMVTEATSQITKAITYADAWKIRKSWSDKLGDALFKDIEYKGEKFPSTIDAVGLRYSPTDSYGYYNRYNTERVSYLHLNAQFFKTLFVTNYNIDLNAHNKGKARTYWEHKGLNVSHVMFINGDWENKWAPKDHIISWDDLKAALPKKAHVGATGPVREPGTFDFFDNGSSYHEKPFPDGTVYYITPAQRDKYNTGGIQRKLGTDIKVVVLAKNRIAKFKRDHPDTKDFIEWAKSQVILDGDSLIKPDAKKALAINTSDRDWLRLLDINKVDDPEIKELKRLLDKREDALVEYSKHKDLAQMLFLVYDGWKNHTVSQAKAVIEAKYPLLVYMTSSYVYKHDDLYVYLNAKYANLKGKK